MGSYAVKLLMEGKGGLAVGIEDNHLCTHDIVDLFDSHHVGDYSLLAMNDDLSR
ncbi:ATP-dependent 6-phosphofructokinase, partial [Lactobacillus jensenii]|nr:ATP-dependent 6-phosphofructokinase [Lactobacillus jensenii]